MKPHNSISHEGTLGAGDRTRFDFHQGSIAHIMRILTDMYENPELAVIREYSTNARDAMVAAGKKDQPIRITAPSVMEPTFIVRDEGVGLSKQEVVENLTKYGYSSKRETDEEVGMLGLGSKSALTYTSQFSYVVCKDGMTVTVLITREDDGAPVLQIVREEETPDALNSVEVHVPVKDPVRFNITMNDFFKYWMPGTVLVNSEEPSSIFANDNPDDPDIWLSEDVVLKQTHSDYYEGKVVIVMGSVPYRVDRGQMSEDFMAAIQGFTLTAMVDIGTCDFTPSREGLMMSKRTKEMLSELEKYFLDRIQPVIQEAISEMNYKQANDWGRSRQGLLRWMFKNDRPVRWNGRMLSFSYSMDIPDSMSDGASCYQIPVTHGYGADRADQQWNLSMSNPPSAIVVNYNTKGSMSQDIKDEARRTFHKLEKEHGRHPKPSTWSDGRKILFVAGSKVPAFVREALGDPYVIDYKNITEKIKKLNASGGGSRKRANSAAIKTRYRVVDAGSPRGWSEVAPDDYKPDAFVSINDFKLVMQKERAQTVAMAGHQIALVWGRNEKWFSENHPTVPTIRGFLDTYVTVRVPQLLDTMTPAEVHRLSGCNRETCSIVGSWASTLKPFLDELPNREAVEVMRVIMQSRQPSENVDKILKTLNICERYGVKQTSRPRSLYCWRSSEVLEAFPILNLMRSFDVRTEQDVKELARILIAGYSPEPASTELVLYSSAANPTHLLKPTTNQGACVLTFEAERNNQLLAAGDLKSYIASRESALAASIQLQGEVL